MLGGFHPKTYWGDVRLASLSFTQMTMSGLARHFKNQKPISYHEWHANDAQSPRLSEPLQLRIWSLDTSILGKIKFFSLTFHCTSTDFFIKWIRWDGKAQFQEMEKLKHCMILNGIQNKLQCRVCYGAWPSNSVLMETSVKLWWQCLTNSVRAGTFRLQKNINWKFISPSGPDACNMVWFNIRNIIWYMIWYNVMQCHVTWLTWHDMTWHDVTWCMYVCVCVYVCVCSLYMIHMCLFQRKNNWIFISMHLHAHPSLWNSSPSLEVLNSKVEWHSDWSHITSHVIWPIQNSITKVTALPFRSGGPPAYALHVGTSHSSVAQSQQNARWVFSTRTFVKSQVAPPIVKEQLTEWIKEFINDLFNQLQPETRNEELRCLTLFWHFAAVQFLRCQHPTRSSPNKLLRNLSKQQLSLLFG